LKPRKGLLQNPIKIAISVFRLSVFVLAFTLFLSGSAKAQKVLVEDFWQRGGPNKLEGHSDVWEKNGSKVSLLFASNDPQESPPDMPTVGYALKLKYDVRAEGQEAGWWTGLNHQNMQGVESIRFWVKGAQGREDLRVGLKDALWYESHVPIEDHLVGGIVTDWKQVSVPLEAFTEVRDWEDIENISFSVSHFGGNTDQGTVYIDQIELVRGPQGMVVTPIAKETRLAPDAGSLGDDALLDLIERASFDYFVHEVNPANGLIKDLCLAFSKDRYPVASIASTGFGLTALCIGVERGWISREDAYERIVTTLDYFLTQMQHKRGFFYHFVDMYSGQRAMNSEISSVDTALFLAGALFAGEYFKGSEVEELAEALYRRTEWGWLLTNDGYLGMGWTPERSFIPHQWKDYSELIIIYLLAIGSPTYPVSPRTWDRWSRETRQYEGIDFTGAPPLFVHQYSHCWVDFRKIRDRHMDYFKNSVNATLANRQWCIKNSRRFKTFSDTIWGLTASDGPKGYAAYGAPFGFSDGTVAPTAAISSIVFTPKVSLEAMRAMFKVLKPNGWGRYGFVDSFNAEANWYSKRNIGINLGPMVLMIENYRSGLVWKIFGKSRWLQRALKLCEFR
jgi:hypothetical protein